MSPSQAVAAILLSDVREVARAASSSQHANFYSPRKMSDPGPAEYVKSANRLVTDSLERGGIGHTGAAAYHHGPLLRSADHQPTGELPVLRTDSSTQTTKLDRASTNTRVYFREFAQQLRTHHHYEHKKRVLQHRRICLQKAVSLTTRLQRVCSWIHDGLVEISGHNDPSGFVRVQQHMQDLVDTSFAHWKHELQSMDSFGTSSEGDSPLSSPGFLSRLSTPARTNCLRFVQSVRSDPRFLIERFKLVTPSQLATLSTSPKFQDMSTTFLTSLSQSHGQSSQKKRIKTYSKGLEDYATSFERSNPLSFLLFNCYSSPAGIGSTDDQLRLSTWSIVCAGLLQESWPSYQALVKQALTGFSGINRWTAKERMELFLMDTLQRGAFLLEIGDDHSHQLSEGSLLSDSMETDLAREFFDNTVRDLFAVLCDCGGGIPQGSLELCCAILGNLPTEQLQSDFRGYMFWDWFLADFLRILITYPENEKMLLQFHISKRARSHILHRLWTKAWDRATELLGTSPQRPVDIETKFYLDSVISQMVPKPLKDLSASRTLPMYNATVRNATNDSARIGFEDLSYVTISAPDLVQVLEALSPQYLQTSMNSWDRFLSDTTTVFNSQYASPNSWIDKLRRELLVITEPGHSTKNVHPCSENWNVLFSDAQGILRPTQATTNSENIFSDLLVNADVVQQAVVRFLEEEISCEIPDGLSANEQEPRKLSQDLVHVFANKAKDAYRASDSVTMQYWENAKTVLGLDYPLSMLINDDSKALRPLLQVSQRKMAACFASNQELDRVVSVLEANYTRLQTEVSTSCTRLNKLKVKMWYKINVVNSNAYEDARNIAQALNHMVLSRPAHLDVDRASEGTGRDGTTTSSSSVLDQPRNDTINILKALPEHGGSTKLADSQIELINRWLSRQSIENFCKGEERIHRFCMEIKTATNKLVGDTLSESPVLWSSELWLREKDLFEVHATIAPSIHGSTRAPSVFSETFSSAVASLRNPSRIQEGSIRSLDTDVSISPARKASFHSLGSARINRGLLGKDLASSLASPGRSSATTAESITSAWSPLPSLTRSMTSMSILSRPSSIYNDFVQLHTGDNSHQKARFVEGLRQDLTSLLLSDLGNPVWSRGSETDAWIDVAKSNVNLDRRIQQRKVLDKLVSVPSKSNPNTTGKSTRPKARKKRSTSFDSIVPHDQQIGNLKSAYTYYQNDLQANELVKFQDLLDKISQQVDPSEKLQAMNEFKVLATMIRETKSRFANMSSPQLTSNDSKSRRKSAPSVLITPQPTIQANPVTLARGLSSLRVKAEDDIVNYLKHLLFRLQPRTIFRDLQYVATFVPSETLNKTESGRAFFHLGLAALGYKDEICHSMVDLADSVVSNHPGKRTKSPVMYAAESLTQAKDYWILAAREGNAIAQRELAGLFLTHPSLPPVVTLPLVTSKSIFKPEMMWKQTGNMVQNQTNTQPALCLALHWMQQAANNGDQVAQSELNERKTSLK